MADLYGNIYQANIAAEEEIFTIIVESEIEKILTEYQDDNEDTELEWLEANYYGKKDNKNYESSQRDNEVGLTEKDFITKAYPKLNKTFRKWWDATIKSLELDSLRNFHILFVTEIYSFPWGLLPLQNGVSISREFSVSCYHSKSFVDNFANNDSMLISSGDLDTDYNILELGSEIKKNLVMYPGVLNSLYNRGNCDPIGSNYRHIFVKKTLHSISEIKTKILGHGDNEFLPSMWIHDGHGHTHWLTLSNGDKIRGEKILEHLNQIAGVIDFCWLNSCHSIQLIQNSNIMQSNKIKTLIGFLGLGDEDASGLAFELMVLERIARGYSIGRAFQIAKSSMDPEMPASGSYTLIGDPRLIIIKS